MNHLSILLNNRYDIDSILRHLTVLFPDFIDNYLTFSDKVLKSFLKEEMNHAQIEITMEGNHPLHKMSSGQQRKALLKYLLDKAPKYLILDNATANLDIENKKWVEQILKTKDQTINIIQITYRKEEIYDWIENKYTIIDGKLSKIDFTKNHINNFHINTELLYDLLYKEKSSSISNPLIKMVNINVSYENKSVLKDLNLKINQGEFWHIKGPNGSGKSTLLSMIYGDNPKAYGQDITLFGIKKGSGENIWDLKKHIGYYAPTMLTHHYRNDSVVNMIIGGLQDTIGLYNAATSHQIHIARKWISAIGLQDIAQKPIRMTSPGNQAVAMIIRAMIKKPTLLILDEPTTNLDDENARLVINLINSIARTQSTAILYVSHNEENGLIPSHIHELKLN
jgi:molybdate transport system ATP-binding protein